MKHKHQPKQIKQLMNRLHAENRTRGWTLHDLAKALGISHIHMASLSNGARKLSGLAPEKQRELAKYLRLSMVEFYLMIGVLRPEDFTPGDPV